MNLDFSTGIQECTINGKCTVYVNFTDPAFIESVFNAFDTIDGIAEKYEPQIENAKSGEEVFSLARARDKETREVINEIFGEDVCSPIFGKMQLSAAADGLPLWVNLLLAIVDNMDTTLSLEKKQTNPRVKKYIEKYNKKRQK